MDRVVDGRLFAFELKRRGLDRGEFAEKGLPFLFFGATDQMEVGKHRLDHAIAVHCSHGG